MTFLSKQDAERLVGRPAPQLKPPPPPDSQLVGRLAGKTVTVRLLDGTEVVGKLAAALRFEVWLEADGRTTFIAKHAVATISESRTPA